MTLNHFVLHTEFQDITYKDTLTRFQLYHETFIGPELLVDFFHVNYIVNHVTKHPGRSRKVQNWRPCSMLEPDYKLQWPP